MGLISRVSSRTYRSLVFTYKNQPYHHGSATQRTVRSGLRPQEDRDRRRSLQGGQGPHQGQRTPLDKIEPECLRLKLEEPLLVVGKDRFAGIDIKIRVSGGGRVAQIYAIRQAISRAVVAYYQKFVDEHSKRILKDSLVQYDRTLMVADPRRSEAKKFGGPGARARYQKSYR